MGKLQTAFVVRGFWAETAVKIKTDHIGAQFCLNNSHNNCPTSGKEGQKRWRLHLWPLGKPDHMAGGLELVHLMVIRNMDDRCF